MPAAHGTQSARETRRRADTVVPSPAGVELPEGVYQVVVRRSERRRRTVAARREGDRIVVMLPARMNHAEQEHWVAQMVTKVAARTPSRGPLAGHDDLARRADTLSVRYLQGRARPSSVRWVSNQRSRWGSCTPADGTIRLSDRLRAMPTWVIDYVLLHELVHLLHPDHSSAFHELLAHYERAERARGFLEGWSASEMSQPPGD
ncbi:M48 metallopeptidase family protein [Propionibacterium freudenreichii]|uniref:M48 metallopeptidase family protein n=1 Tax=Propionibacterium freudenreichii TaxID=1744 RepID=UPI0038CD5DBF